MHAAPEESLAKASGPYPGQIGGGSFTNGTDSDRVRFDVEVAEMKKDTDGGEVRWPRWSSWRRRRSASATAVTSVLDMTVRRSCGGRSVLSVPVVLWATVCLMVLLSGGAESVSDERTRFSRSKYEQESEAPGGMTVQDTYNVVQLLQDLLQKQQQQQQQMRSTQGNNLQMYNNGEDLSDREIDWRKIPLPLLYQLRSLVNEGSKEEDKRGSYMSLCHFKICNLG